MNCERISKVRIMRGIIKRRNKKRRICKSNFTKRGDDEFNEKNMKTRRSKRRCMGDKGSRICKKRIKIPRGLFSRSSRSARDRYKRMRISNRHSTR
jgi:hypothetical protein